MTEEQHSRTYHEMAVEIDYLRTALGWQHVPDDELDFREAEDVF